MDTGIPHCAGNLISMEKLPFIYPPLQAGDSVTEKLEAWQHSLHTVRSAIQYSSSIATNVPSWADTLLARAMAGESFFVRRLPY